jgi:ribosomal protein S3AE
MRIAKNIKLSKYGRKDMPASENWYNIYKKFPIDKLKVGHSFNTEIDYEYGRTISIKNSCRNKARKLNLKIKFAVREWKGKIRVWRIA